MLTPVTNSTSKPTSEAKSGSGATNRIELDPWEIADLLICKRGDQFVSVEFATDPEFDTWVKTNSIPVKENGVNSWTFDDRCRVINHVLGYGGSLEFADGSRIPEPPKNSEKNSINSESSDEFGEPTNSDENEDGPPDSAA